MPELDSTDRKRQVDVYLEMRTIEQIEDQLEYGDGLSPWIREACRQRLERGTDSDEK